MDKEPGCKVDMAYFAHQIKESSYSVDNKDLIFPFVMKENVVKLEYEHIIQYLVNILP